MNESSIQQRILLEAAQCGAWLGRNNVGACMDDRGRMIRYGLANESERINRVFKSSDLIGFRQMLIMPEHVGRIVAVFSAIECKRSDWKFSERDDRAVAQLRFIDHVRNAGGFAGFCNDPDQLKDILKCA